MFSTALGSRIKGLAQQARGQPGEALSCLDQVCRAFEAAAMPFDAARARLEWATLVATNDTALAVAALQESLDVFQRLGAQRYTRRARRLPHKLVTPPPCTTHAPPRL